MYVMRKGNRDDAQLLILLYIVLASCDASASACIRHTFIFTASDAVAKKFRPLFA